MNQKPENGNGSLRNLSDQDLQAVSKNAERSLVEAELMLRGNLLVLDILREEKESRESGKPRRPAEEWQKLWFEYVNEVAAAHKMDLSLVWEIARKTEAKVNHDFNLKLRQEREAS